MTDTEAAPAATSIAIPAPKLREMLTAVLPHAGTDDTLPMLMTVRFELRDGVLYLVATDRFTLGVARYRIPGAQEVPLPDQDALLPLEAARELHRHLEPINGLAAIVIRDGTLTVDYGATRTWKTRAGDYAPWRNALGELLAAQPAALDDEYGINTRKLARFATAGPEPDFSQLDDEFDVPEPDAVRIRLVRANAPGVLVTRGDWFIGALMGFRVNRRDDAIDPDVPQWDTWTAIFAEPEKAGATS